MKRVVFADPTAWWVPVATVIAICGATWGGLWWNMNMPAAEAFKFVLGLAIVLLALVALQGRLLWKTDIAELSTDGSAVEAKIARWLGPAPRLRFSATEARDWRVISYSSPSGGKPGKPNLGFTLNGREYRLSLFSAKTVDFEGLRQIDAAFFGRLVETNPALVGASA